MDQLTRAFAELDEDYGGDLRDCAWAIPRPELTGINLTCDNRGESPLVSPPVLRAGHFDLAA